MREITSNSNCIKSTYVFTTNSPKACQISIVLRIELRRTIKFKLVQLEVKVFVRSFFFFIVATDGFCIVMSIPKVVYLCS